MRIMSKGQVTIPQAVREEAGLLPHTEVEFIVDGDGVRIVKVRAPPAGPPRSSHRPTAGRAGDDEHGRDHGPDTRRAVIPVLVDSNGPLSPRAPSVRGRVPRREGVPAVSQGWWREGVAAA